MRRDFRRSTNHEGRITRNLESEFFMKNIIQQVLDEWNRARSPRLAAALAYYALFSLAPAIFIAFTVADLILDDMTIVGQIMAQVEALFGAEVALFINDLVMSLEASTPDGTTFATLVSFVVLLYAASSLFAQLKYALNTIWGVSYAEEAGIVPFIKNRLLAFLMVISLGFLLIATTLVNVIQSLISSFIPVGPETPLLSNLAMFGLAVLAFAFMYKVLPDRKIRWGDVWLGAVVTTGLFFVGLWLISLYFRTFNIASAVEAAGAVAIVLVAFNYLSYIFLFGGVFTKVMSIRRNAALVNVEPDIS